MPETRKKPVPHEIHFRVQSPTLEFRDLLRSRTFWKQVKVLTQANLKSRYRKTWAGFFWVVFNPIIMFGVQSLVFGKFLRLQIPNYSLFLLSGLLPWIFISQSLEMCTGIFVASGRLFKSFPVHPLVYLAAQLADNTVNFSAAFTLLLIPVWIAHPQFTIGVIFLPLAMLLLGTGVLGMCWLLATLQVFFRDTRFIVTFVMSFVFYLTPVFYSPQIIPANLRWLITINPFGYWIKPFRTCIYDFNWHDLGVNLGESLAISCLMLSLGLYYWYKKRNEVYFHI